MHQLPSDLGCVLPIEGDPERGEFLVREAVTRGDHFSSVAFAGMAFPLRVPENDLPIYANRLNATIPWVWRSTPASDVAMREVEKVEALFIAVTRVTLIIPSPNIPLLLHYDPVVGNEYESGRPFQRAGSDVSPHMLHAANRHLCLKLPITERRGEFGRPMLRYDGVTYRYHTDGRFFLINEIDILHGAGPVPYHRGVLWIDGILDHDAIRGVADKSSIQLSDGGQDAGMVSRSVDGGFGRLSD